MRALYATMAVYLAASAIETADQAGLVDDDSLVASTAEAMRETRSGDDPLGLIEGVEEVAAAISEIASAFEKVGNALD